MSHSTTAGCLPRSETTDFTSQLQVNVQEAPGEDFPEYHDIAEKSASQVADRCPGNAPLIPAENMAMK